MIQISLLLEKFKNVLTSKAAERKYVSDALFNVLNVRIAPEHIEVKERTAIVPSNPVLRSELMLKKGRIIEEIQRLNSASRISDVR